MDEEAGVSDAATAAARAQATEVALERGPGVHVVADGHPVRAGRALAAELGAELADTAMSAEAAIRTRLALSPMPREAAQNPARAALLGASHEADLAPGPRFAYAAPDPLRTLAAAHITHLRQLAAAVERTDRIRARTEQATTDRLASSQSGVAVHPETVRHAAAGLIEARSRLAREDPPGLAAPSGRGTGVTPVTDSTAPASDRASGYAPVAVGVLLLAFALAGAVLVTGLSPVIALAPILLGVFLAGLIRQQAGNTARRRSAPSLLPLPSEPWRNVIIDAPTAGDQSGPTPRRVARPRAEPLAAESVARQELEEAERAWTSLVGPGIDPEDVDEVVLRRDPQANLLRHATADNPSVRAATLVTTKARDAWEAAWRELGAKAPTDATSGSALDQALARLQAELESGPPPPPIATPVDDEDVIDLRDHVEPPEHPRSRSRLNELLARRSLEAVLEPGLDPPSTVPLVLVEPFAGLDPGRRAAMQRQLELLAAHHEVIVIVGTLSPPGAEQFGA